MLRGKHIVIGVSGGIAAYKAVYLLRKLQEAGATVRVTMTEAATRFVGRETFASLTRFEVPIDIFPDSPTGVSKSWTKHIEWGEWADLIVVAPCTANTLAKIVNGFSDSMLTAMILAARCNILLCPTMDGEMYRSPATRYNLDKAGKLGFKLMEPSYGYLASGLEGQGRLPEPEEMLSHIEQLLENKSISAIKPEQSSSSNTFGSHTSKTAVTGPTGQKAASPFQTQTDPEPGSILKGKKVLVTCGATREFLDPVRFLSNPSTGKMGIAMAQEAAALGADVILLHSESTDVSILPESINKESFISANDLFSKVKSFAKSDIIIMAAAVSDFKPGKKSLHKVKKDKAEMQIALERTPDILQWLGKHRPDDRQVLIGFAMETEDLPGRAKEKRLRKNTDWIVGNNLQDEGAGFAVDTNRVLLIGPDTETRFEGSKSEVARSVLHHIFVS
ncbi:MAG: bifunctional phosphopantothenoylcysteine decarboxylase/phosphopantothenate synthase [Balneolales bacterium]